MNWWPEVRWPGSFLMQGADLVHPLQPIPGITITETMNSSFPAIREFMSLMWKNITATCVPTGCSWLPYVWTVRCSPSPERAPSLWGRASAVWNCLPRFWTIPFRNPMWVTSLKDMIRSGPSCLRIIWTTSSMWIFPPGITFSVWLFLTVPEIRCWRRGNSRS